MESKIRNIISVINKLTNLEYAVFDVDSKLIASTDTYLDVKGDKVHSESIQDVLKQGNVIVHKPGHMTSCVGCRFVNKCPSTIEILSCIKLDNEPIGIVSLTSFSKEGRNMIEANINTYIDLLKNTSELLAMYTTREHFKKDLDILHLVIENLIEETGNNYIVIDEKGDIIHFDAETQIEFFSYCNLYTNSIDQAFPLHIVNWIFSTNNNSRKFFNINNTNYNLHVKPIKVEEQKLGYIIQLEKTKKNNLVSFNNNHLDLIISKNKGIYKTKDKIRKIASSPSPVIITGKTGTGKEMFAQAIHYVGSRADKPFIAINCSNIPESLFESELFGYEEGSFTGAKKGGKIGVFEMAHGGSLFLDEIGELPLHLQAKLLRVLQENTIQRVGSTNPIPIDIRLIAATNKDLEEMMIEGKFRDDLFYRINVISITLPTLEERQEDIEPLTNHFIEKHSIRLNKNINKISPSALKVLQSYTWPGNIRELENAIEYGLNMEEGTILSEENLPHRIRTSVDNIEIDIKDIILERELEIILNKLDTNGWDLKGKEKTSVELGMSLRTLYRKIKDRKAV